MKRLPLSTKSLAGNRAPGDQIATIARAPVAEYEVTMQSSVAFAEHDGIKLVGDFCLPKRRAKAPALIAIHGGGWQIGDRSFYKYWGPFLAHNGYAVFAIEYRLGKPGVYPNALYDVKAALQFVRAKAPDYDIDPDRVGLIGDSAGAHLASLLALAGGQCNSAYANDAHATTPVNVNLSQGTATFPGTNDSLSLTGSFQEVVAGTGNDTVSAGSAGHLLLFGGTGNDSLSASGGSSVTLVGGAGNDTLSSSYSSALLEAGSGNAVLSQTGGSSITMFGGTGNDTLSS